MVGLTVSAAPPPADNQLSVTATLINNNNNQRWWRQLYPYCWALAPPLPLQPSLPTLLIGQDLCPSRSRRRRRVKRRRILLSAQSRSKGAASKPHPHRHFCSKVLTLIDPQVALCRSGKRWRRLWSITGSSYHRVSD